MAVRPALLLIAFALGGCTTSATTAPPEKQFVLAGPVTNKTEAERERALQIAQNDCKVKAMAASVALEKSITSERNSIENLSRAREKAAEMYTSSFTLCMLNAGYSQK